MNEISLNKSGILKPGDNATIHCLRGAIWITWRGGDVVLRPGDRFDLRGLKRPLVQALADSMISMYRSGRVLPITKPSISYLPRKA